MTTETVQIVDRGRGPQLSTSRITVLDVFYYLHRGHDFDVIRHAMPTLKRADFDVIVAYVNEHREELVQADRRADEYHQRGIEAQHARGGIFAECDADLTTEERVARLEEKMSRKVAEKNGARNPG